MSGALAEVRGPDHVLRQMLAAKQGMQTQYGPNEWRDRLTREMLQIVALKAHRFATSDATLQSLIASVFQSSAGRSMKH
jgi:hypothetical protein